MTVCLHWLFASELLALPNNHEVLLVSGAALTEDPRLQLKQQESLLAQSGDQMSEIRCCRTQLPLEALGEGASCLFGFGELQVFLGLR